MPRPNHLATVFALGVSFFATLTFSSFGDPGDPAPGRCPATKGAITDQMAITKYQENQMAFTFDIAFYAEVDLDCALTPATVSCCRYCMLVAVYIWDSVLHEYVLSSYSSVEESAPVECGKSLEKNKAKGEYHGSLGSDYKFKIKFAKYDCRLDDDDVCCRGCQNTPWSSEATYYLGTSHD